MSLFEILLLFILSFNLIINFANAIVNEPILESIEKSLRKIYKSNKRKCQ